jgi:hypothetical protein
MENAILLNSHVTVRLALHQNHTGDFLFLAKRLAGKMPVLNILFHLPCSHDLSLYLWWAKRYLACYLPLKFWDSEPQYLNTP